MTRISVSRPVLAAIAADGAAHVVRERGDALEVGGRAGLHVEAWSVTSVNGSVMVSGPGNKRGQPHPRGRTSTPRCRRWPPWPRRPSAAHDDFGVTIAGDQLDRSVFPSLDHPQVDPRLANT